MADLYGTESGQNGGEGFEVNPIFQSDTVETWHGNNYPVNPHNEIQQFQAFEDLTMDQEVSNNSMHNSDEEYFLKLFQDFFQ
uniref:Uncharacterized protein n=1 Tax=Panagrolaimus superbus TaxID=310955 RepID=A0A914YWV4_9BILA